MSVGAISDYLKYHKEINFENEEIRFIRLKYSLLPFLSDENTDEKYGGRVLVDRKDFCFSIDAIEHFMTSRHSVRDFSGESVDIELLRKAIKLASRYPSACNRQATRAYILCKQEFHLLRDIDDEAKDKIEVFDKRIIVTAKLNSYGMNDRYQYIVSSSIFAAYLSLSLHLYGIGACLLHRSVTYRKKALRIHRRLGIPDDERIILMIGVGMLKDAFYVPVSYRFDTESIMKQVQIPE